MQKNSPVRILAIESSCDETAAAVMIDGENLVSNVVASQMEIHARYGGVYPEVASRQHVLSILPVIKQCLAEAHLSLADMDAIAVTSGPGLAGSLVVGLNAAKGLAIGAGKPLIGVNHLEGHIYSSWVKKTGENRASVADKAFPHIALLVSGGHTEIILMRDHLEFEKLGSTLDDAAGEAFDKTARLIGLPYPGGPSIQEAAYQGDERSFNFTKARTDRPYDFSFSGLKTAVLREVRNFEKNQVEIPKADLAASFQRSVVETLVQKTILAAEEHHVRSILVAGGVSANQKLRDEFAKHTAWDVFFPEFEFCTDNAAMIGAAGYFRFIKQQYSSLAIDVEPTWSISR
jgi:N6-L-threonylcarbamoyladenine synthase